MEMKSCFLDSVVLGQVGHISSISCWKEPVCWRAGNLEAWVRNLLHVREQSRSEEMLNVTLCCSLSSVKRNLNGEQIETLLVSLLLDRDCRVKNGI